jgi:hypothetical protein
MAGEDEERAEALRDTTTPRGVGPMKADGRRFTKGVHANGGKRLVVRALRDVPELDVRRGEGYVLVDGLGLPRTGQVTLARGNAMDPSTHFRAPTGLFSADWRESTIASEDRDSNPPVD